jgi:hypothetical protein
VEHVKGVVLHRYLFAHYADRKMVAGCPFVA